MPSDADLPNGLYDQLVTSALEAKLRHLDAGEVRLEALGADRLDELRVRLVETILACCSSGPMLRALKTFS